MLRSHSGSCRPAEARKTWPNWRSLLQMLTGRSGLRSLRQGSRFRPSVLERTIGGWSLKRFPGDSEATAIPVGVPPALRMIRNASRIAVPAVMTSSIINILSSVQWRADESATLPVIFDFFTIECEE